MVRSGVFIGVDRTGTLEPLHDAAAGARRMYEWALAQRMPDCTHAKLITDEGDRKVTADAICDAIERIIDGPGVDQLIVYFAGHGVNINRNEHWLLSDAPARTSAAVNVTGSVELARYSGIRHVVFVSDACRVAPEGIQAQNVRGVDVFPNDAAAERAHPVDQFFACLRGRPAAEIRDPALAAAGFCALYTEALLDALWGREAAVLELSTDTGDSSWYVKPAKLEEYLEREIPRRVQMRRLQNKVNQNPEALILVHRYWLSRIAVPPSPRRRRGACGKRAPASENLASVARTLIRSAAAGGEASLSTAISDVKLVRSDEAGRLASTAEQIAVQFGPDHFGTGCGVKVRGARIVEGYLPGARTEVLADGALLQIEDLTRPAASVLLCFDQHVGTVIPAIAGFVAALTFDPDGSLVDVAYEPSTNTSRWPEYARRASEVRALRAVAASASQHGRFRLEGDDAMTLARKMQFAKGVDPTLAVYAAYAYYDLQQLERIREMSRYLMEGLDIALFDVELLGKRLVDKTVDARSGVVPFAPLLAQGWALLGANRVRMSPSLQATGRTLRDSLWTLVDSTGVNILRRALTSGELR